MLSPVILSVISQQYRMRAKSNICKIVTIAQMFIFKWRFVCRGHRGSLNYYLFSVLQLRGQYKNLPSQFALITPSNLKRFHSRKGTVQTQCPRYFTWNNRKTNETTFSEDILRVVAILILPKLRVVLQSMVSKRTAKVHAARSHVLRDHFFLIQPMWEPPHQRHRY